MVPIISKQEWLDYYKKTKIPIIEQSKEIKQELREKLNEICQLLEDISSIPNWIKQEKTQDLQKVLDDFLQQKNNWNSDNKYKITEEARTLQDYYNGKTWKESAFVLINLTSPELFLIDNAIQALHTKKSILTKVV